MYGENKFTEALDWLWLLWTVLWPVPVFGCIPLLIFWAGEHHPAVLNTVAFGVIVVFIPLSVAILILSKVLRDIFSLFHR